MALIRNVDNYRTDKHMCSYDSNDDLRTPFNNDQLLIEEQEDEVFNIVDYRLLTEGEAKGPSSYKQISESSVETSVYSSSKSPLKMVFKKTSGTTTVSPSVTPEPSLPTNKLKISKKQALSRDLGKAAESFDSPSQVTIVDYQIC